MNSWSGKRYPRYRHRSRSDHFTFPLVRLLVVLGQLGTFALFGTTIITGAANLYVRTLTRGTVLEQQRQPATPIVPRDVSSSTTRTFEAPAFARTRAFPRSGSFFLTEAADRSRPEAVLELKGSEEALAGFVVVLHDLETGHDTVGAFVRGKQTARIGVPVGQYRVRIASGTYLYWAGIEGLFGSGTAVEELRGTLVLKPGKGLSLDVTPRTYSVTSSGDPISLTDG